jgi:hypothetical protein
VPRRAVGLFLLFAVLPAIRLRADARSETARYLLRAERRELAADMDRVSGLGRELETALADLASASRAVGDASSRTEAELVAATDSLRRASSSVDAVVLEMTIASGRIARHRARIARLEADAAEGRAGAEDPLSGDWTMRVDPGSQTGEIHFSLDGTLVSGDYTLEGGFSGSIRGTLVGDRLRFERVDSRLGFNAVYYGRLVRGSDSISGTWEATELSSGGPSSGTWAAQKKPHDAEE